MEVEAPAQTQVDWPGHTGVEGLAVRAARTDVDAPSAAHAIDALRAWLPGLDSGRDPASLVESTRPDRFPYAEVLAHYHRVGRTHADRRLVSRLRHLSDLLRQPELTAGRRLWPLPQWLPSTVDQCTGNYDSYLVTELLEGLTFEDGGCSMPAGRTAAEVEQATDSAIDMLAAALVADLALIEADALRANPSREQRRRTRACLLLLTRLDGIAPRWTERPALDEGEPTDAERLAETTAAAASRVRQLLPRSCRQVVNLSLLPTTRLHDELMFVRGIQVFETSYRQVYRCLVRASAAMQVLDLERACAELADATGRVAMSSVLYRVVTTMPRAAFAIIRGYTNGRSAIQSRSYRQIDLVCAPRPQSPVADKLPAVEVTSPTLQEAFFAVAPRLAGADAERLAERLRSLDTSWRAMKRTHWGITLKIIGRVPGTGGTTGAEYLKQAAETPLFPALVTPR